MGKAILTTFSCVMIIVLAVSFFVGPSIVKRYQKEVIEKAQQEAEAQALLKEAAADGEKRRKHYEKIDAIVESSHKPIGVDEGVYFVPLNLPGLPSKNLETISIVLQYMRIGNKYYSGPYTVFQIEYTDTETIGLWFKSNTVHVR